ncbi:MAG: response regulator [Leptolyngbyaceae cyanobacterium MO_188.B28]|nr:response regulator [Leptolyngbyaceae cyanobacterium MO_188.B28]
MLIVDDEPDNLDLLYRTFRRDFQVLRAESGLQALELLSSEGEVAVIISDQRMPEMKGTEFLSKTVPEFPDTVRIILTGFTDVEDLVDAINAGQVYRYITKPWDPDELKTVVHNAAETYDLLKQRLGELEQSRAETSLTSEIVTIVEKSDPVNDTVEAIAKIFCRSCSADICLLQLVEGGALSGAQGSYGASEDTSCWLTQEPLTQVAITTKTPQINGNISVDATLSAAEPYVSAGIQSGIVAPIIFRGQVLAVLALLWRHPQTVLQDKLNQLNLPIKQLALALAFTR